MRPFYLLKNSDGQALVETLFSLPVLVAGVTLVLGGLHSLSVFFLADSWTYELSQCLVMEESQQQCSKNFSQKVKNLPFASVKILQAHRGQLESVVRSELVTPLIPSKIIETKIKNQLNSESFRGKR